MDLYALLTGPFPSYGLLALLLAAWGADARRPAPDEDEEDER